MSDETKVQSQQLISSGPQILGWSVRVPADKLFKTFLIIPINNGDKSVSSQFIIELSHYNGHGKQNSMFRSFAFSVQRLENFVYIFPWIRSVENFCFRLISFGPMVFLWLKCIWGELDENCMKTMVRKERKWQRAFHYYSATRTIQMKADGSSSQTVNLNSISIFPPYTI